MRKGRFRGNSYKSKKKQTTDPSVFLSSSFTSDNTDLSTNSMAVDKTSKTTSPIKSPSPTSVYDYLRKSLI